MSGGDAPQTGAAGRNGRMEGQREGGAGAGADGCLRSHHILIPSGTPGTAVITAILLTLNEIITPGAKGSVEKVNTHRRAHRHTDTQTQTDTQTRTETHRHTDTHRHAQTHRHTHTHTETHTGTHTHTQTHRDT